MDGPRATTPTGPATAVVPDQRQWDSVGEPLGHGAGERPSAGGVDHDIDEPSDEPDRSIKDDDPVARRAAGELRRAIWAGIDGPLLVPR